MDFKKGSFYSMFDLSGDFADCERKKKREGKGKLLFEWT